MKLLGLIVSSCAALGLLLGAGCANEDLDEIKKNQEQILAKLEKIEKKSDEIASRQRAAPQARRPSGPDPAKVYDIPIGKSAVRGPKDAKVTIVEFSDFECPYCARSTSLVEGLLKAYPNDVNFVYKQFPLESIHKNARPAARASLAAGEQGKFWEMHDLIFKKMGDPDIAKRRAALQPEQLKSYAGEIGLDVAKFEADMKSPEIDKLVQEDINLGTKIQVRGTPTFFVNGKIIQGAQRSAPGFKQLIDGILKGEGGKAG